MPELRHARYGAHLLRASLPVADPPAGAAPDSTLQLGCDGAVRRGEAAQ
jgi:hypothetical protein